MNWTTRQLVGGVQSEFAALADPQKAAGMQAYLKTEMPCYGIQKPQRQVVLREVKRRFPPRSRRQYEAAIKALWRLPHREEKYAAMEYAHQWPQWITAESIPLYERMIRDGAWWDLVDFAAIRLVGQVRLQQRRDLRSTIRAWLDDDDLWIRRTVLISQIGHKQQTNEKELFAHCRRLAHESDFFIRKAIGWALREYSKTQPDAVRSFLLENQRRLSPLSFREGAKVLLRQGKM